MKKYELHFYDIFGIIYKVYEVGMDIEEAKRIAIRRYKNVHGFTNDCKEFVEEE